VSNVVCYLCAEKKKWRINKVLEVPLWCGSNQTSIGFGFGVWKIRIISGLECETSFVVLGTVKKLLEFI
jgi:hypothetical protein